MTRAAKALTLTVLAAAVFLAPPVARAAFGPLPGAAGFEVKATEADGSPAVRAGSHPYALITTIALNKVGPDTDGDLSDIRIDHPPGLVENSTVVGRCEIAEFNTPRVSPFQASLSGESCPQASQIGTVEVTANLAGTTTTRTFGLFNLVPPPGFPALIGASPFGMPILFAAKIDSAGGGYRLSLQAKNISQQLGLSALEFSVWGNPWLVGHDRERGNCLNEVDPLAYFGTDAVLERESQTNPGTPPFYQAGTCSIGNPKSSPPLAYLTLPTSCADPIATTLTVNSWQAPSPVVRYSGEETRLSGCEDRLLQPEGGAVRATSSRASSATGLDFSLAHDQETMTVNVTETGRLIPEIRVRSQVRKAVVTLPDGMRVNPSMAAGLGVCSAAGYAAETATSLPGEGCPNASKIGEMVVESPILDEPIRGGLFIAAPYENPFGSLLALYLVAKDPAHGVIVKLPGEVAADPASGRLVTTFDGLPQLPYSSLLVRFREGQRSPLATPSACGRYAAHTDLTPWLDQSLSFRRDSVFDLIAGVGGGPCPGPGFAPFAPRAAGGTANRNAGSYSPFYLHLTRGDGEQEITSYSADLPKGLLGKIAGVPFCPEAQIAAAARNSGFAEAAAPSCPAASKIGRTATGYGLGSVLAYAPGGLYLAGPYHGSPLSVVALNSATVGPYDLGTIIVRSAIRVDPRSGEISIDSAGSDPIPHIIKGIPLHLRDIRVYIDRPNFMVNPTSCDHMQISSALNGSGALFSNPADDTTATATAPFQVSSCGSLGFEPRIALRLGGGTRRSVYPALRTAVTPRPGNANIGKAVVTLPPALFLAQEHIDTICSRPQSAASKCPAGSIYGKARAITPLLDEPLEGPVYLRASGNKLPDLVAELHGRGVRVDVVGRIDSVRGGMRATYDVLPDAPVSKFVLTLKGGKHGLLVNSDDICASSPGSARMVGQNNSGVTLRPKLLSPKCSKTASPPRSPSPARPPSPRPERCSPSTAPMKASRQFSPTSTATSRSPPPSPCPSSSPRPRAPSPRS
jgi:hypothetical protein